jgi:hypothetical protein
VADQPGRDFFISYTQVNRPWAEWIAVQLEAADLFGRLCDGWTRRPRPGRRGRVPSGARPVP